MSYYGQNALFRNNGNGTFKDVTKEAGLLQDRLRWNSGCAFLDYDKDGRLDLFVGNYIDFDVKTAPRRKMRTALTRALWWRAGRRGWMAGRICCITTTAMGRFKT